MNQELLNAVKERLELGYSHDAIRDELRSAGHGEDSIEEVLRKAQTELHPTVSEVPAAAEPSAADPFTPGTSGGDNSAPVQGDTEGMPVALIGYGELLSKSWSLFKMNIPLFSKAVLVGVLLFMLLIGVILAVAFGSMGGSSLNPMSFMSMGSGEMLGLLAAFFIGFLIIGIGFRIVSFSVIRNLTVRESSPESFTSSLRWSVVHIVQIIVLGMMVYFTNQLGYTLLLIPGIALAVYLMFSSYALAREEGRYLSAMVRSTELVYGRWWGVFGRVIVAWIVAFLILIGLAIAAGLFGGILMAIVGDFLSALLFPVVFLLALGYTVGYTTCVSVTLMESLVASKQPNAVSEKGKKSLRTFYLVTIILGVLAAVFVQGSNSVLDDLLDAQSGAETAMIQQTLANARSQAELYSFRENSGESYLGVCTEIESSVAGAAKYSDCIDSEESWALSATADSGEQYCVDSESSIVRGPVSVSTGLCQNSGTDEDSAAKERANDLRGRDFDIPQVPSLDGM